MKKLLLTFTGIAAFMTAFSQLKDSVAVRFSNYLTAAGMSENLKVLASDEYEGRETGTKGQKMSAEYISAFFKKVGIPAYNGTYYQQFPLMIHKPQQLEIMINEISFKQGEDFYSPSAATKDSVFIVEHLQFAGYGIRTEKYNDYAGTNVAGKSVLILDGEPTDKKKNSLISGGPEVTEWSSNWRFKVNEAKAQGISVLFVAVKDLKKSLDENSHRISSYRMSLEEDYKPGAADGMSVIYINEKMADVLLKKSKNKVSSVTSSISKKKKPVTFQFDAQLRISVKQTHEKVSAENVLGFIEGSDLKNEVVVLTAHYDHLGKHDGVVYNGADDDGSGTVAVMELARAFAAAKKNGKGPRRSILFMTVAGEEKGLLGSDYYSRHPVFDLKNTVANLNIDMIGRLDEKHKNNSNYVYIIGSNMLSSTLHEINQKSNELYMNIELDYTFNSTTDPNRYYYRSDHYNFAKNNIPVIFYFNGVHADYHKETDEVQKIDFNKMEKISRLVFFTAWELANRNERITVDR
jgi:hypothetical protein